MKVCVIGNLSDRRCGFQNFTVQTDIALRRAGLDVTLFDGTYSAVYARREAGIESFFPPDVESYDVLHLIWNAMTMNHYSGADWASLRRPVISWWDGGPSDASCPFLDHMQVRWSDYPRDGYHYLDYPVPDWVEDLPAPDPAAGFVVGASSVRGDGITTIRQVCAAQSWTLNLPTPGVWLSLEAEIRRLARSTVNVCWYHTPALWKNRASAPSMLIAAKRPVLINHDDLMAHLHTAPDLYHADDDDLATALHEIHREWQGGPLHRPFASFDRLSWSHAATQLISTWKGAR